jgi:hypothetical protein
MTRPFHQVEFSRQLGALGLPGEGRPASMKARAARIAPLAIAAILLGLLVAEVLLSAMTPATRGAVGFDYGTYVDAARRWLAGGSFYQPYQLAGPYTIWNQEILYPPTALLLFVPFTFLPAVLWWALPLGVVGVVVAAHRPSARGWVVITALLVLPAPFQVATPWSIALVVLGNPGMWAVAAVAAGTRWAWPGALVVLKPSLFPFALVGIRTRGWWIALGLMVALSVILAPLWAQYATVLTNAHGSRAGLLYSLSDIPVMLVPVVAWLSGRHRPVAFERFMPIRPSWLRFS